MSDNFYQQERELAPTEAQMTLGRYTAHTYALMFLGLLVTFGIAFFGYYSGLILVMFYDSWIPIALLVAQLAVAIGMTAALHKISTGTATVFFFLYSALTGIVFSTYFLLFDLPSMILAFAATALYFGGMALFGHFTDIDLSRLRPILLSGLLFILVLNLLMLFIPGLAAADRLLCTFGVVLFLAYTAYDAQKIRAYYAAYQSDEVMLQKAAIYSALQLYLDFVNLFIRLLSLFGKRKK